MRIEQNNQYFIQYTGLGAKSKSISKKDAVPNFLGDLAIESDEKLECSPLSQFKMANNNITPQLGVSANKQITDDELSVENDDGLASMAILDEKRAVMNNLLKKLGIDGQVNTISMETVPQDYTMYYIETNESDAKNILVIEFENGELGFIETDQDKDTLFYSYHRARTSLGMDNGKLSVDKLKEIFAKYFEVDELKDFILEFSGSEKKS